VGDAGVSPRPPPPPPSFGNGLSEMGDSFDRTELRQGW